MGTFAYFGVPEWRLSSGHAHPDANSFIIWAHGQYLTGDTGYSGLVSAKQHNTITIGGTGQGVETDHDVWRGIPYATLDRTRIVSADFSPSKVVIVGDAAASYPESAVLKRFTRTFTFQSPDRFVVEDLIDTGASKPIEYYLHADHPVRGVPWTYQIGPSDVWLETTIVAPDGSRAEAGPTELRSPGQPGSIERGAIEQRGFELKISTPAASSTRLRADMVVKRR